MMKKNNYDKILFFLNFFISDIWPVGILVIS